MLMVLASTVIRSQDELFKDISLFKKQHAKPILLYFHFDGCPPCKKMDEEVLSDSEVKSYVLEKFDSYSVYNFNKLETGIRAKYNNRSNPEFLVLDTSENEIHRFVGFFTKEKFLTQLEISTKESSLANLERIYCDKNYNLAFLAEYIKAKENANQIDTFIIFEYIDSLLTNPVTKESFQEILHYGYYHGSRYIRYNTQYFTFLDSIYRTEIYKDLNELLRPRLLISINEYYHRQGKGRKDLINKIKALENGERNYIKGVYDKNIFALIPENYPSFDLDYQLILNTNSEEYKKSLDSLLSSHLMRIPHDLDEQHRIAKEIYSGYYSYSNEKALEIIQNVLKKSIKYSYLDTYAALLLKDNKINPAREMAQLAVQIAKIQEIDPIPTLELLKKMEEKN